VYNSCKTTGWRQVCERYVPCLDATDVVRRLEWAKQHRDFTWTGTENLRYPNVLNRKVGRVDIDVVTSLGFSQCESIESRVKPNNNDDNDDAMEPWFGVDTSVFVTHQTHTRAPCVYIYTQHSRAAQLCPKSRRARGGARVAPTTPAPRVVKHSTHARTHA
jgi:hypothetical protein